MLFNIQKSNSLKILNNIILILYKGNNAASKIS